jgi:dynein heavy chain
MEAASNHEGPDLRLDFMGSFIQKTLKLKVEKWQRLLTFEEHRTVIKDFLDVPTEMVLVIQFTQSAQLLPTTTFPLTQLKAKGVYFVKRLPIEIPRQDCGYWLVSGDLATRSIDQLSCLVDEIFVPLLSNTDNHKGWPEM